MRLSAVKVFTAIIMLCITAPSDQLAAGELKTTGEFVIRVPKGFSVEQAAGLDQVPYAMFGAFDDRGRLFITQSSGKNIHGLDMAQKPECRILMLEDTKGNGLYDRVTVYADKVGIPMGIACHGGSIYVASPPDLLRFDDKDGDGVAEQRTVLLTGWNVRGTASLHGPFFGPDGWLYLTDGRHGFDIKTKEETELKGLASRIWRLQPDGSKLESFCGGGFDNPVELVFAPSGEMFGTMTYFTDPMNGQRDALMHWIEGGVYRKYHDCVKEFKLTGDLMPPMTKFARIAPAGLARYEGTSFGSEYQGNLFSAQFNPHRVQRHRLFRDGATFRTEDEDFLTSTDPDFHPTDILEDADGSLLVVDTGGWYVDQCPLSRVSKPEKRGGIYRIRKNDVAQVADPRGLKLNFDKMSPHELVGLFEDARPKVRERAQEMAVQRGEDSVIELARLRGSSPSVEAHCAVVWALMRIGSPQAQGVLQEAINDGHLEVQIAAIKALGLAKDKAAAGSLIKLVKTADPAVRRETATALGRMGDPGCVPALLEAATKMSDRFEEHAVIYALIQLKEPAQLMEALKVPNSGRQRAALIALDQMDGSPLQQGTMAPLLQSKDKELWRAALWVVSHHPDWSGEVVNVLQSRLSEEKLPADEADSVREALLSLSGNKDLQKMLAELLGNEALSVDRKLFLLDVMDRCAIQPFPAPWIAQFDKLLHAKDDRERLRVVTLLRSRNIADLDASLKEIVAANNEPTALRVATLSTIVNRQPQLTEAAMELLLAQFQPGIDATLRVSAAHVLRQARLSDADLLRVANGPLMQADALTVTPLLDAFRNAGSDGTGQALVESLTQSKMDINLLSGGKLEQLLQHFPKRVQMAAKPLLARIQGQQVARIQRLNEMESLLSGGDVGRGRRIFFGPKASCSTCHAIGKEGATLAPDLTSIGSIRSGRDILEAIVFPSASFVPGYEPFRIETRDETYTGLIAGETADVVILKTAANTELRIPRKEIRSLTAGTISIMPEGLDTALTKSELLDLLAFLQAQNGNEFLEAHKH
ncbi:PVC-type heme-binding CxxCH protein [Pedosphaera parvula]|uniref:Membrane-bound dehydrogenase domain protein n=1 Tax=Pedosphaera parvula (strain Ellin514) TaxID=320771 RepID=B9XM47_PEDPL|nr:PVC-type heme-binding CxxCH protein [Pedosphaera parvula]EEF59040.1 membrane-bound dehydrogenase domain protein [Pedosphaera parvula Ellin514]